MFQLKVTPEGIEKVIIKGVKSASKLIIDPIKDTSHIFENVQGVIKELFQIKVPCLVIGTRVYLRNVQ